MNRQWLRVSYPKGSLTLANFEYRESSLSDEPLQPGEVLVRNEVFALQPGYRVMMDGDSPFPNSLGMPVRGWTASRVVKSENARFPVGSLTSSMATWEDYSLIKAEADPMHWPWPADIDPIDAMSIYSINALTAYFGLLRTGRPKPGETVVVSSAAGSIGSLASQIARIQGCRVIGIGGGPVKCAWLLKECHIEAAIDYKNESVPERLKVLAPRGVDLFFDNVGGTIMQDVIEQMAAGGRIVICGQMSGYDGKPTPGPRNMTIFILRGLRMEGCSIFNHLDEREAALSDLRQWKNEGKLIHKTDVRTGFKNLPKTFFELFSGGNDGTLLLRTDKSNVIDLR
jgi:NADPH-dependent curcumin reductase CurA